MNYSISTWVNIRNQTGSALAGIITIQKAESNAGIGIDQANNTVAQIRCASDINNLTQERGVNSGSTTLINGTWYFITCMYTWNNATQFNVTMYKDGIFSQQTTSSDSNFLGYSNMTYIKFGVQKIANQRWFNGSIDEVRIFNRTLTPAEIVSLNNTNTIADTTGLMNYYSMDVRTITNATLYINDSNGNLTQINESFTASQNVSLNDSVTLSDGIYNWWYSLIDYFNNNIISPIFNLFVDTTNPVLTITLPQNISYNTVQTRLNYTINEVNIANCSYSLNNGLTNTSVACGNNVTGLTGAEGSNTWTVYAIDNASNVQSASVTFAQDSLNPQINVTYPRNITYNVNVSNLNYTVSDVSLQSCKYSLDNGLTNTSISCGTNLTGLTSNEGTNIWTVYTNDSYGNKNSSNVTFVKDTINPQVNITLHRTLV
jgi:hypothetical protein